MIADSIAKYLQSLNVGKINKDIFIDFQPDEPDDCITIYNGSAPVLEESNGLNIDNAGIQILIRDNNYNNAKLKAQNIYSYLISIYIYNLDISLYLSIKNEMHSSSDFISLLSISVSKLPEVSTKKRISPRVEDSLTGRYKPLFTNLLSGLFQFKFSQLVNESTKFLLSSY